MPPELNGYRTLSQIGVGARSTINQIVRTTTGHFYALKRVVRKGAEDDPFIKQVETEFEVGHAVDHPAVRKCLEIHRDKKWFKITEIKLVMEYVAGKTLEQDRPEEIGGAIRVTRQIAEGLHAMHEHGFVHADIKPSNVILTEDGVKIIDLGQSCPVGHKKERIQGTPDYISPEQVRKLPLDQRTDVFNLGATLYWVLTNRNYPTEIRQSAKPGGHEIASPTQTPKDINPKIHASLSQLAMDCCKNNPADRPAGMKQVVARLDVAERMWKRQRETVHDGTGE